MGEICIGTYEMGLGSYETPMACMSIYEMGLGNNGTCMGCMGSYETCMSSYKLSKHRREWGNGRTRGNCILFGQPGESLVSRKLDKLGRVLASQIFRSGEHQPFE